MDTTLGFSMKKYMFKLLSRSTRVAGRLIFVISGWRLEVDNSESQFRPKSFTTFLITFSFLNIFEQNQKEVLEDTGGHLTIGFDFSILPHGAGESPECGIMQHDCTFGGFPSPWGKIEKSEP